MHGSEEVVLNREDDGLLQQLVAHQKLLTGPRNVSVAVLDAHTRETRLLHLESYQLCQVHANLGLLGWVDTWVCRGCENVKTLISNLVYHIFIYQEII